MVTSDRTLWLVHSTNTSCIGFWNECVLWGPFFRTMEIGDPCTTMHRVRSQDFCSSFSREGRLCALNIQLLSRSAPSGLLVIFQVEIEDERAVVRVDRWQWSSCGIRIQQCWRRGIPEGVYGPIHTFQALHKEETIEKLINKCKYILWVIWSV